MLLRMFFLGIVIIILQALVLFGLTTCAKAGTFSSCHEVISTYQGNWTTVMVQSAMPITSRK